MLRFISKLNDDLKEQLFILCSATSRYLATITAQLMLRNVVSNSFVTFCECFILCFYFMFYLMVFVRIFLDVVMRTKILLLSWLYWFVFNVWYIL